MEPTQLEQALFRTLAYFAYFQYPLTIREMHTWLLFPDRPYTLLEVETCIGESSWLKARSERFGVYVSLQNVDTWIKEREKKYIDAQRKHHKARTITSWLMRIPGVSGVAICNSLAWHATHATGDIDLFVITRPNNVWTARFFAMIPLRLLRLRPGELQRDPVCLSFFVDEQALALETLKEGEEDWYLAYWIASLRFIGGDEALSNRMLLENTWIKNIVPNAHFARIPRSMHIQPRFRLPLFFPESLARTLQEKLFPKRLRAVHNQSTHVVVNDRMLKFHYDDRRAAISAFVRLYMQQAGL